MKIRAFLRGCDARKASERVDTRAVATGSRMRRFRGRTLPVVLALGMAAVLSGPAVRAAEQAPAKVRIGDTVSFAHLGAYVGIQKGMFLKHGIEIERVVMPGGSKVLTTLLSGDIDIAYLAAVSALQAQFQNRPVKIVGASHVMEIYSLLGRNDLKGVVAKPADLRNRTVGITAPGSGSWAFAKLLARAGSLDASRDMNIVPVGDMMTLISALKSNRVDTVTLWEPGTTMALEQGVGYSVIDLQNPVQHEQFVGSSGSLVEVIAAREDFIAAHRDALHRFFAAQNEAYAWTHRAPIEEVAQTVAPLVGNPRMDILQKALKRMIPGVPKTATVEEKMYTATMKRMVDAGLFKDAQPFAKAVDNGVGGAW